MKKNYAGFSLDVSFALEEGKITGFIGRNGAGKTTTIKSLLGFVHPDAGDIRFFSMPFAENEMKIKSRLGVVLGGVNYYPQKRLDPVSRDEILYIFISLSQDEGKTVFCSTHITSDLDRCADNIIYLKQGRIAEDEPLCTLLQKYSVVQFSADNAPKNIDLIGARREKDGMSALVRNSELPTGVESAPAGLEDIMVHIEREGETK